MHHTQKHVISNKRSQDKTFKEGDIIWLYSHALCRSPRADLGRNSVYCFKVYRSPILSLDDAGGFSGICSLVSGKKALIIEVFTTWWIPEAMLLRSAVQNNLMVRNLRGDMYTVGVHCWCIDIIIGRPGPGHWWTVSIKVNHSLGTVGSPFQGFRRPIWCL